MCLRIRGGEETVNVAIDMEFVMNKFLDTCPKLHPIQKFIEKILVVLV